jgi:trehalose 6-phosphate phosphatase
MSEALAPLRSAPRETAILLDIDGTLAPIVEHASDAHVPESTRQLLIAVADRYGMVGCVSGRRASEARAMVSIGTITYLGSHGVEMLRSGWTEARLDGSVADWVRRIQEFGREADTAAARRLRVRLEDKGAIVAFHWREQAGLATHWGRKVLEVRPPVPFDKGAGIRRLLAESGSEITNALYVGDDSTDLDAFRALAELVDEDRLMHGIRVGVASDEGPSQIVSEADLVVEGPDGVRELLGLLTTAPD